MRRRRQLHIDEFFSDAAVAAEKKEIDDARREWQKTEKAAAAQLMKKAKDLEQERLRQRPCPGPGPRAEPHGFKDARDACRAGE